MSMVGPVSSPVNLSDNLFQNTQELVTLLSTFVRPFLFIIPSLPWKGSYLVGSVLAGACAALDSDLKTGSEKGLAWVKGALEFVPIIAPALQIISEIDSNSTPKSSSFVMGCLGLIADISFLVLRKNKIPVLPGLLGVVEDSAFGSIPRLSILENFKATGTKILDEFHVTTIDDLDYVDSTEDLDALLFALNRHHTPYANHHYSSLFSEPEHDKFLIEFNRIGDFITKIEGIFLPLSTRPINHTLPLAA